MTAEERATARHEKAMDVIRTGTDRVRIDSARRLARRQRLEAAESVEEEEE